MRTWLTETLEIEHPIVSAPMAGVAGGELAAAVSAAGALGMVGVGVGASAESAQRELGIAAAEGKPFGVGVVGWAVADAAELADVIIAADPALVCISYGGELSDWVAVLHDAGIPVATQVGNPDDAREADGIGVDLLVARGGEAGGHGRNEVGTLPLLQAVLDEVDTPVIAAGGIGTARGLAAVLAAGACGGWIGTAFAVATESLTGPHTREALVAAEITDTVYTRVFDLAQRVAWPREFAGRALVNDVTLRWAGREDQLEADEGTLAVLAEQVRAAKSEDDPSLAPVYAGQSAGLVTASRSAARIVADLARAEDLLRNLVADL